MIILFKYCAGGEIMRVLEVLVLYIYILVKGPCIAQFYDKIYRIYVKIIIITK